MQSERFFNERMLAAVADDWEVEKRRNVGDFGRGVSTPMTHMAADGSGGCASALLVFMLIKVSI